MLGNEITTTAVIGQVSRDPPTVEKYSLNAKDSTLVTASTLDTLRDTSIVMDGTTVVMSFTKLLKEVGEVEITMSGTNYFIAAKGTGDWLGPNHTSHGSANKQPRIAKDFSLDCPATLDKSLDLLSSDTNPPNPSLGTMYYAVVSHSSPSAADGVLCARVEIDNPDEGW